MGLRPTRAFRVSESEMGDEFLRLPAPTRDCALDGSRILTLETFAGEKKRIFDGTANPFCRVPRARDRVSVGSSRKRILTPVVLVGLTERLVQGGSSQS